MQSQILALPYMHDYNDYKYQLSNKPGIQVIDNDNFQYQGRANRNMFEPDGVHLNIPGKHLLLRNIAKALRIQIPLKNSVTTTTTSSQRGGERSSHQYNEYTYQQQNPSYHNSYYQQPDHTDWQAERTGGYPYQQRDSHGYQQRQTPFFHNRY